MSACCGPSRPIRGSWGDTSVSNTSITAPASEGCAPGSGITSSSPVPGLEFVKLPGGEFTMGTSDPSGYRSDGEGPEHVVDLAPFAIARFPVTNDQFAVFVESTGYRTTAERFGNTFVFAGLLPDDFPATRAIAATPWWREVSGGDWQHPEGPQSDISERGDHPVVHVGWNDAAAFCRWSGTRLATEAEWEYAARGGIAGVHYPWGAAREPNGEHLMNVYQGEFPYRDTGADGWIGTCPVGSYPSNGYGLHEMTGNVWEWCLDWFDPTYYLRSPRRDPHGPPGGVTRVMRGGSYLCHESYCWRYRVDARSANTADSTTGNLGFRVVQNS